MIVLIYYGNPHETNSSNPTNRDQLLNLLMSSEGPLDGSILKCIPCNFCLQLWRSGIGHVMAVAQNYPENLMS